MRWVYPILGLLFVCLAPHSSYAHAFAATTERVRAEDPIGFAGGESNLYVYAGNDPVNFIDPNGTHPIIGGILVGIIGGGATDALVQLATNGFRPDCLSWGSIGTSAALGGALGGIGAGISAARAARGTVHTLKDFSSVATRNTRGGGQGVRLTRSDGSVLDITGKRVKEFVPNMHPSAPPGTLRRVKFPNAQPGTKGFKRNPTPDELRLLEEAFR